RSRRRSTRGGQRARRRRQSGDGADHRRQSRSDDWRDSERRRADPSTHRLRSGGRNAHPDEHDDRGRRDRRQIEPRRAQPGRRARPRRAGARRPAGAHPVRRRHLLRPGDRPVRRRDRPDRRRGGGRRGRRDRDRPRGDGSNPARRLTELDQSVGAACLIPLRIPGVSVARTTTVDVREMKRRGERVPMITAYDYPMARLADAAGIPLLLVGDSLGTTVLGYDTTIPVTLDDVIYHTLAVVRGSTRALVIADMPFMSYQIGASDALRSAGRLLQEGGAQAVKIEGGAPVVETVRRLVEAGIPVQGHLGLTPQSVHALGGYRLQGRDEAAARRLVDDARALEEAGVFSLVLELI